MAIKRGFKEQTDTHLEDLFQEFQSSFDRASPEEKERLSAQFYHWAEKQVNSPHNLKSNKKSRGFPEECDQSPKTAPGVLQSKQRQYISTQDVQSLIDSDIFIRQIAENIEHVFWLSDIHSGCIIYVNSAFEMIWGRSRKSLYADPTILIESVHPEDRVQVLVANPDSDHKPFNQTYRILRPEGSMRWIFARTFLMRDETGEPSHQFCIAQDITDQKQIELTLRKTLDRTREQFNLSHKMSLARKPETVLNKLMSAHELRSAQRADLLFFDHPKDGPGRGVELTTSWLFKLDLAPWLNEPNLYEDPNLLELLQTQKTVIITRIQSDPRLTPLLRDLLLKAQIHTMVIFPLMASANWLGSLVVYYQQETRFTHIELRHLKVLIDQATITLFNLKLLEIEEESRHEAQRANEIKTEFLAMISHELRTPLTSIIGFTTTLLAEDVTWEADEHHDFIKTIQQEANRLQELIDHLLDLSRLEAGMLPILLKPHSLHDILQDATPQFQTLIKGQSLTIDLPPNLPPVHVDARRIAQVLVNLVRNASTYAPKGTEIKISAVVRSSFIQIDISDQGPGIAHADHKKVFKAFIRGQNEENGSSKGAGLGLAICKGLVEAHGGRIWIRKKTTPGATISFTIPLVPSHTGVDSVKVER